MALSLANNRIAFALVLLPICFFFCLWLVVLLLLVVVVVVVVVVLFVTTPWSFFVVRCSWLSCGVLWSFIWRLIIGERRPSTHCTILSFIASSPLDSSSIKFSPALPLFFIVSAPSAVPVPTPLLTSCPIPLPVIVSLFDFDFSITAVTSPTGSNLINTVAHTKASSSFKQEKNMGRSSLGLEGGWDWGLNCGSEWWLNTVAAVVVADGIADAVAVRVGAMVLRTCVRWKGTATAVCASPCRKGWLVIRRVSSSSWGCAGGDDTVVGSAGEGSGGVGGGDGVDKGYEGYAMPWTVRRSSVNIDRQCNNADRPNSPRSIIPSLNSATRSNPPIAPPPPTPPPIPPPTSLSDTPSPFPSNNTHPIAMR